MPAASPCRRKWTCGLCLAGTAVLRPPARSVAPCERAREPCAALAARTHAAQPHTGHSTQQARTTGYGKSVHSGNGLSLWSRRACLGIGGPHPCVCRPTFGARRSLARAHRHAVPVPLSHADSAARRALVLRGSARVVSLPRCRCRGGRSRTRHEPADRACQWWRHRWRRLLVNVCASRQATCALSGVWSCGALERQPIPCVATTSPCARALHWRALRAWHSCRR